MKRQLVLALGLAVVSVPALASKARLESLGQSANGSQYIHDHRSVFLNAASLNQNKDFVTIEVGNTAAQPAPDQDDVTTPKAEGGVFKSSGNMVYGIYFGEESNDANNLRNGAGLGADAMERNSTTFFVGGDAGVQWGAALLHQAYKSEGAASDTESSAMRARLGVIKGNTEVFANIGLTNKAEDGTNEFEGKGSYDIGVTHKISGTSYMARVSSIGAENKAGDEYTAQSMSIGAAREYKLNDKARMWASAFYTTATKECKDGWAGALCGAAGSDELKAQMLPVTISLEVDAKDWLVLRGFVAQNVLIGKVEVAGKESTSDGLNHGIGASLKFGDLSIDGSLILTNQSSSALANDAGTLNLAQPMNRVSLTYNF